jgi:hypothetical protein
MTITPPTDDSPLTDEELQVLRATVEQAKLFDQDDLPLAFRDRERLLKEVDRLRAENTALAGTLRTVLAAVNDSQAEQAVLDSVQTLVAAALGETGGGEGREQQSGSPSSGSPDEVHLSADPLARPAAPPTVARPTAPGEQR